MKAKEKKCNNLTSRNSSKKTDNLTDIAKLFLNQILSECIFCTKVKSGCRYRNVK